MNREEFLNLRIAHPCPARWEAMEGDEIARFCKDCKKRVHNISAMSSQEARELLASADGALCVRFDQTKDGTVVTTDGGASQHGAESTEDSAAYCGGDDTIILLGRLIPPNHIY